jgi:murein DD-endopeptidase MepM/ murein hydrolase activator NlpD
MRIRNFLYATVAAALLVLAVGAPVTAYAWGGNNGCGSYVVQRGDTLFSIGMRYGMTVAAMRQANPNLGYWLYAGQTISIPCGGQDGGYDGGWQGNNGGCGYQGCDGYQNQGCGYQGCDGYQNQGCGYQGCDGYQNQGCGYQGCDGYGYQDQGYGYQGHGDSYQGQWDGYHGQDANYGGCNYGCSYGSGTYVVQRGDTLAKIAARFGTTWYQLCVLNGLWNPNLIYAGQVLRIR